MKKFKTTLALFAFSLITSAAIAQDKDGKLRIICFGAHPDDCELQAGGVGAMWAKQGHKVKFVSMTNGDIGHWREAGGPLARRRLAEVKKASEILGTNVQVMDIHDGELMPSLENRLKVTRAIREWKADLVLAPRPNDYHPDHRYTGILVQDAAFMVAVPFICPDVEPLRRNPVFMYYSDRFQKPNPSAPDIAISIDSVIEQKLDALAVMESQFLEGGALGGPHLLPRSEEHRKKRISQVRAGQHARYLRIADKYRDILKQWYGDKKGSEVKHAVAYEVCEYGRRPSKTELKKLFPFYNE